MLNDAEQVLSDAQAITGDAASTNVYDFRTGGAGEGNPEGIRVHVDEAFNTLTSLDISIQTDSDEAFGSAKTLITRNVLLADLAAKKVIDLGKIPSSAERYVRVYYNVNGSNPTTGKVTAYMHDLGNVQTLPDNTL